MKPRTFWEKKSTWELFGIKSGTNFYAAKVQSWRNITSIAPTICWRKDVAAFHRLEIWVFHVFSRKFLVFIAYQACFHCYVKSYPGVEPNG